MSTPLGSLDFHRLFDAAADAQLLVDEMGNVLLANESACDMFGYTQAEMLTLSVEALMPVRFRDGHCMMRNAFFQHPQKRAMGNGRELFALSRDGHELMVDIGLSPIRTEEHAFVLITMLDATRRRRAQQALEISEERLRLAKRATGLGIFDYRPQEESIELDKLARMLLGLGQDEIVTDEKLLACVHPEDRVRMREAISQAMLAEGSGEYAVELRIADRDAMRNRHLAAVGQVFFEDGKAARLVGTLRDITAQKVVNEKLKQQRAEMEALMKRQVAAQTASAIAHELNQPLAALSAYSEVALHELQQGAASEKAQRALAGCVEQAHRAGSTLHELLEFLHAGHLATAPMDLLDTVQEAIAIARTDVLDGFHASFALDPTLPPVLGNRLQVQKVLSNLVRNSLDAMSTVAMMDPGITIRVQRTATEPCMAMVTVQDSGPGFDAETAQRIFEPFFTTKSHGIGMGLAISRALIQANGGQLWADSSPGHGATFHFTLPFAE